MTESFPPRPGPTRSKAEPPARPPRAAMRRVAGRRAVALGASAALTCALLGWLAALCAADGFGLRDGALLLAATIPIAWTAFYAINALIATVLLLRPDPRAGVSPFAASADGAAPLTLRTAIVCAVRHEDVGAVIRRLCAIRASLDQTGAGAQFDLFLLSDSDDPDAIAAEEAAFAAHRAALDGRGRARYRRRTDRTGFKAGNIRAFVDAEGRDYDLMACLDADSLMDGATLVAYARILEAEPRLALLQSLILPAAGATLYTRALRFGAEITVLSHYLGHAWWQADAGPFGGHNALVRLAPFRAHCRDAVLAAPAPFGGPLLGHDHIEAAQLNAAGWEVRLWPARCGSWEDYPVNLVEHAGRDARWARGNLQYLWFVGAPGLRAINRFHLGHLLTLPLASAFGLIALALAVAGAGASDADPRAFIAALLALALCPKIPGWIDAARRPEGAAPLGGWRAFAASAAAEILFTLLAAPVVMMSVALAVWAAAAGRPIAWPSQARAAEGLSWRAAATALWGPTLIGGALALWLAATAPTQLVWAAPALLGPILSIPLAVFSARARDGVWTRLFRIPAEIRPDPILSAADPIAHPPGTSRGGPP